MEENKKLNDNVSDFYDEFSKKQLKTGINLRHYYLFNQLIKAGLKKNSSVLEIGCGIGTLTGLIASYVKRGEILVTDISPENIALAQKRLAGNSNVQYVVSDMSDFKVNLKFDFVVLADVIEHIPEEDHSLLFKTIRMHLHGQSNVFFNIPHPKSIEFYKRTDPSKLQIIDQSIYAGSFVARAEASGLILKSYKEYSLFHCPSDYVIAIYGVSNEIDYKPMSKIRIIAMKLLLRIVYHLKTTF
jgi:trans-aconitate 2-methyltransferase